MLMQSFSLLRRSFQIMPQIYLAGQKYLACELKTEKSFIPLAEQEKIVARLDELLQEIEN